MDDKDIIMQVEATDDMDSSSEDSDYEYPSDKELVSNEDIILDNFLEGKMDLNECLSQMKSLSGEVKDEKLVDNTLPIFQGTLCPGEKLISLQERLRKSDRRNKCNKKDSRLDPALAGMIGQANMKFAHGNIEEAFRICLEVIRQQPISSQPYHTLSMLYEYQEDHEQALRMKLIAAFIGPTAVEEWLRLSDIYKERGDIKQAISCLSKAIHNEKINFHLYVRRANLLTLNGSEEYAMKGLERVLSKLNSDQSDQIIYLSRTLGKYYMKQKQFKDTERIYSNLFEKCTKNMIDKTDVCSYLEVLLLLGNYKLSLRIISAHFNLEYTLSDNEDIIIETFNIPSDLDLDILSNVIIILIRIKSFGLAESNLNRYLNMDIENVGEYLYKFAIEYMGQKMYKEALNLLTLLIDCQVFKERADVWKSLSECYEIYENDEKCLECYYKIIELQSDDIKTRIILCQKLKYMEKYEEALAVTCDSNDPIVSSQLVFERCCLCYLLKNEDEFMKSGYKLLSFYCTIIKETKELDILCFNIRNSRQLKQLSSLQSSNFVHSDDSVTAEDLWDVCRKMFQIYMNRKEYNLLQQLVYSLYSSNKLRCKRKDINISAVISSLYAQDYRRGYDMILHLFINRNITPPVIWNLLNLFVAKCNCSRLNKWLVRSSKRDPNNFSISVLYANYCLMSGCYIYALNNYFVLFQKKRDPLFALELAITNIQLVCQKHTPNKNSLVTQALYFLKEYEKLRGPSMMQEIYYNTGRALQQVGFVSDAAYFYKKVLDTQPVFPNLVQEFDLTHEAAFNLSLIYRESGYTDLEEYYIQKYIII